MTLSCQTEEQGPVCGIFISSSEISLHLRYGSPLYEIVFLFHSTATKRKER